MDLVLVPPVLLVVPVLVPVPPVLSTLILPLIPPKVIPPIPRLVPKALTPVATDVTLVARVLPVDRPLVTRAVKLVAIAPGPPPSFPASGTGHKFSLNHNNQSTLSRELMSNTHYTTKPVPPPIPPSIILDKVFRSPRRTVKTTHLAKNTLAHTPNALPPVPTSPT